MSFMRGRSREWLILGGALALTFGSILYGRVKTAQAERADERAQAAEEVVNIVVEHFREQDQRLVERLEDQRRELDSLIGAIPPVTPSDIPVRIVRVIEQIPIDPRVRDVLDSAKARIVYLEAAVEERDNVIALFPQKLEERDSLWMRRIEERDKVISSLELALDLQKEATDKWRDAATWSKTEKALWTIGGAAVGGIAGYLIRGEKTVVKECSCYDGETY